MRRLLGLTLHLTRVHYANRKIRTNVYNMQIVSIPSVNASVRFTKADYLEIIDISLLDSLENVEPRL